MSSKTSYDFVQFIFYWGSSKWQLGGKLWLLLHNTQLTFIEIVLYYYDYCKIMRASVLVAVMPRQCWRPTAYAYERETGVDFYVTVRPLGNSNTSELDSKAAMLSQLRIVSESHNSHHCVETRWVTQPVWMTKNLLNQIDRLNTSDYYSIWLAASEWPPIDACISSISLFDLCFSFICFYLRQTIPFSV